jgi:hypothetical protein
MIILDLSSLYEDQAKIKEIPVYLEKVLGLEIKGKDVILTGQAHIWLYLKIAHHLHGIVKSLSYDSPVTEKIMIFDHDPY